MALEIFDLSAEDLFSCDFGFEFQRFYFLLSEQRDESLRQFTCITEPFVLGVEQDESIVIEETRL